MKRARRLWRTVLVACMAVAALGADAEAKDMGVHEAPPPSVGQLFSKALQAGDDKGMRALVENRTAEIPDEVIAIVQYAVQPGATQKEQDGLFNLAGTMAKMYADKTGDERLLNGVRMNYQEAINRRQENALPPAAVEKTKKDLATLGSGAWRVTVFELDDDGALNIEIGVQGDAPGASMTPSIDIPTSQKAKDIVVSNLPTIKNGAISWSSMGVGLKTVFIGEGRKR